MIFKDRFDAAEQLSDKLTNYKDNPNVIILAIPRGGLEIGSVLAKRLHAPLDVIFTKKIGYPGNPEYAIGAVSLESVIFDKRLGSLADMSPGIRDYIEDEIKKIRELLKKREHEYRSNKPPLDLKNKIVIVTDDGAATGKTLESALALIKKSKPKKIVIAVPVISQSALALLNRAADELIYLTAPAEFFGVGQFYERFDQVDDHDAIQLLHEASAHKNTGKIP